jgi:hypothetical protein
VLASGKVRYQVYKAFCRTSGHASPRPERWVGCDFVGGARKGKAGGEREIVGKTAWRKHNHGHGVSCKPKSRKNKLDHR